MARKLNVKVEFCKAEKDLAERMKENGEEKPSLIIFDMNNANAKPLTLIPKLKNKLKKGTSIIGFLSHVQGDLKQKAHEVGCDMVLPRSAFSQNLPQLLRRHGAPEDEATGQAVILRKRSPWQSQGLPTKDHSAIRSQHSSHNSKSNIKLGAPLFPRTVRKGWEARMQPSRNPRPKSGQTLSAASLFVKDGLAVQVIDSK